MFKITGSPTIAATIASGGKAEIYGIHFDTDKSTLKLDSAPVLAEIAALMKASPGLTLEVSGHTDNTGEAAHNLQLSEARAHAVVTALVSKYHVDPKRFQAKGYGDTRPIAPNSTTDGKAKNRRVELAKL